MPVSARSPSSLLAHDAQSRLTPERFRRMGQLVECIAREPGSTRRELAQRFCLSERQLQADLKVIREAMRLPLVRRQGYRFAGPPGRGGAQALSLEDAQLLLMLLRQAARDQTLPMPRLQAFAGRALSLFPAHLQPLLERVVALTTHPRRASDDDVFPAVADALLRGARIQVHYAPGEGGGRISRPVVSPELLMPYLDSWLLLGHCEQLRRPMLYDLASMSAVTVSGAL